MYLYNKNLIISAVSILLVGFTFFLAPVCQAVDINSLTTDVAHQGGYETQNVDDTTFSKTVGTIIRIVLGLVGTIFIALSVYAGILWMTASGEDEKVTKAKDILQAAVIGLVITVSAYSITYFVTGWLFNTQEAPEIVGGVPNAQTQ